MNILFVNLISHTTKIFTFNQKIPRLERRFLGKIKLISAQRFMREQL